MKTLTTLFVGGNRSGRCKMFVHSSILFLLIWSITGLTANAQPAEGDLEIVPIDEECRLSFELLEEPCPTAQGFVFGKSE